MKLICPVRPGDRNEELRYAARSWETNLHLGVGGWDEPELWTVGYRPSWLAPDCHIDGNRHRSVALAVWDNVWLAAKALCDFGFGDEEVLWMNDDFFCLDPTGAVLPVRRNATLAEHIAQFPDNAGIWWPRSLKLTHDWLVEEGDPCPLSYEVHRPLPARPAQMLEALDKWGWPEGHRGPGPVDMVPQWRSIYGNVFQVAAYPVQDVKLGLSSTGEGSPWVSTSDQNWRRYARTMQRRFQKPSRWEKS